MKITVIDRPPVRVTCRRYSGPFGEPLVRFWRATVTPWLAEHGLLDCPRYGLPLDDPGATAADHCRYDACVALPAGLGLADTAETIIPGGRYAVTHFKGTGAQIPAAWADFMREVQADPANRFDSRRQPFEHYPRGALFDTRTGVFRCELCLPVTN
jgi:AraC family transcriptional regulator